MGLLQHWANWAEVGNRLGGVFARAAADNIVSSDGNWRPSRNMAVGFAAASRQGPNVVTGLSANTRHQERGQEGGQRHAYQALLEHYEVLGVSSGLWRQRRGIGDDEPEAEQEPIEAYERGEETEIHQCNAEWANAGSNGAGVTSHISHGTPNGEEGVLQPWRKLATQIARALHGGEENGGKSDS